MRLLQWRNGTVTFTKYLLDNIPPYAILSHTWGEDDDEVTFRDIATGTADQKPGYQKILFCGKQASHDGLEYFWVDSCCIDRSGGSELQEAITSMFRWYQNASKCYVYLSDVVSDDERQPSQDELRRANWKVSFRNSRWFTRGWTLQELLAPQSVEFFSKDASKLGNKTNLSQLLQDITGIPINAFEGTELSSFSDGDKMSWAKDRNTKRKEDKAYCLLGIFGISMRISYGEGEEHAMRRLRKKIEKPLKILLESLDYNHPFTRVNNISEPSDGTFAWILDPQYCYKTGTIGLATKEA
ncbi:heterokaryon incompatibility protein-domain-containing protein [Hypoxylon argillaceum]|nr:heterokaryon incompatibility protein-domain-containing protein [Hypoxylon argillaceum]